ncbi:C40 family peptidase [Olivibacter sp. CPCC 100613]|uniref:C40 family peptidase n=1 Tax=Olivibacter sp. CPCC 100613 TaxID=3079931 RepID=UPI002FF6F70C
MRRINMLVLFALGFYSVAKAQSDSLLETKIAHLLEVTRGKYTLDKRTVVFELHRDSLGRHILETSDRTAAAYFSQQYKKANINQALFISYLPDTALRDTVFGLINVSVGNMRTEPKNTAEMASQALLGWPIDVLKEEKGYYLVRTIDGYISWLDAAAIALKTKNEIEKWNRQKKIIVTSDYGHVYSEQDKKSLRVSDIVMGNILIAEEEYKDFFKVVFPDGRRGYVDRTAAMSYNDWKHGLHPTAETVLEIAKTMMGVPYLWGGTSVKGVDCSGFTKTAYLMNGFIIPRDASQQVLVGKPVDILTNEKFDLSKSLKNLNAGDLLFFASGRNGHPNAKVTHVALYMGNGTFIHAAGKVRINSMVPGNFNYDDFESRTVVAARRYLVNQELKGIKKIE